MKDFMERVDSFIEKHFVGLNVLVGILMLGGLSLIVAFYLGLGYE